MTAVPQTAHVYVGTIALAFWALIVALTSSAFEPGVALLSGAAAAALLFSAYRVVARQFARLEARYRHAQRLSDLHLATVEALALAIDARDEVWPRRFRHGPHHAAAIARALGMSEPEIHSVRTASLLHDIGKLAVPDHILAKSGPLTQEEFHKIRTHPQIGADIIGNVPFPHPVAPLILCHHERWDGNGYPVGLSGEEIPLGARILSVVDYFSALISERPYQRALSAEDALQMLAQESGKAFDPSVVRSFVGLYPSLAREAESRHERSARPGFLDSDRYPHADGPAVRTANRSRAFQDIALAHREIHGLYEIAQAVGSSLGVTDTMALISSKLSSLIPFSCCALFLRDPGGGLRCAFANGVDADLIKPLTIREGHGVNGWVARSRRPIVNGRPCADLESAGQNDAQTSLEAALICPLIVEGRCIGTLAVYHEQPAVYNDDHRRLLERISEQAAAVIHHSLVFEQTQEDSLTDPLTGLPNTRFMVLHVKRELLRAKRLDSEVSLLVMDLDDFKDINDTYGHHVGDRALRDVGGALRAAIRPYDVCVRYAGDEFIAVLSGCGREEAEQKRLDVQRAIAGLPFEPRPGEPRRLAMSVGAAVYPHDGDSYEALLAAADARMYGDKTGRKGRTRSRETEPPTPDPASPPEPDARNPPAGLP